MKEKQDLLHTPEGVRDIAGTECEKKLVLEEGLMSSLRSFGYHPIQTPTFEFFDVFGKEIGTTPSRELYKFFDREGNTLVLRPDITPSIARVFSKLYLEEDWPRRLCYKGNTYINNSSYQGRLKEVTQIGAELLSDDSVEADAEILALACDCIEKTGLTEFQISVGHALFFEGIMEEAFLPEETVSELRHLIENKNFFGASELFDSLSADGDLKELLNAMGRLYQSAEEMEELKDAARGHDKVMTALNALEKLDTALKLYGVDRHISYELGMIGGYEYYTGIVFAGFSYGSGEPILKGGRYDRLLQNFGKAAPAIGFAFVTDQLLSALLRQDIEIPLPEAPDLIVYEPALYPEAIRMAKELRSMGRGAELLRKEPGKKESDYRDYQERNRLNTLHFLGGTRNE